MSIAPKLISVLGQINTLLENTLSSGNIIFLVTLNIKEEKEQKEGAIQ